MSRKKGKKNRGSSKKQQVREPGFSSSQQLELAKHTFTVKTVSRKQVLLALIKWAGLSVIAICCAVSFFFAAGKQTEIVGKAELTGDGNIDFNFDINLIVVGIVAVALLSIIICLHFVRMRKKLWESALEKTAVDRRAIETEVDPNRTSSGLTDAATTPESGESGPKEDDRELLK